MTPPPPPPMNTPLDMSARGMIRPVQEVGSSTVRVDRTTPRFTPPLILRRSVNEQSDRRLMTGGGEQRMTK